MNFLTNDKLVIVGAGGAIGSNMAQTALMLGLTGGFIHIHADVAGQRIVRSLIRRDFLFFQYRTGRFHLSVYS